MFGEQNFTESRFDFFRSAMNSQLEHDLDDYNYRHSAEFTEADTTDNLPEFGAYRFDSLSLNLRSDEMLNDKNDSVFERSMRLFAVIFN